MKVQNLSGRGRFAGALLVLAGLQYVALEYITARAWHHPTYSYAVNFISDLGNPVAGDVFDGRTIDSPLHSVMNTAFVGQGVLFIAAALLLAARERRERLLFGLVIAHGVGVILVGFFHESAANQHNGVLVVHGIGAAAAIVSGNVVAILVGTRRGTPRWLRRTSIALGALGLASFALLQADRPLYHAAGGIPERGAVYTILAFEILLGTALLVAGARRAPECPLPVPTERLSA
ncbi:DUF998 domain-containing protein [Nocardia sp. NPDC051981]|uniref:DUF998 domain-containing protein n=1 Tax=Nocardia sp. NPDC051981 TaxID=3155417 RepID=UPI0034326254